MKMSNKEVGEICFAIVKYRMGRTGAELRPNQFASDTERYAKKIGCSASVLTDFFSKFLLAEAIKGCGLKSEWVKIAEPVPTANDLELAYRIVRHMFFTNTANLGDEISRISRKTGFALEKVSALATHVLLHHLQAEVGEVAAADRIEFVISAN